MVDDWDYSMIALHHAGRSVGCGAGAGQMRAIQSEHQTKFDDIGYHYGIDCMGKNIRRTRHPVQGLKRT
ncbi:hypothetical protein ACFS4T_11925 [Pseudomonas lini]